jgi:hypothetical protein
MWKSVIQQWVVVLFLLAFSIVIGKSSHAVEVKNLARNGDFEEGLIEWNLRQDEGAIATMKEEKKDSIKGRSCVYIKIDNVAGTAAWHLALYQDGHQIEKNKTYTLSFWTKAEEFRPVAIYVEQAADPWDEYGRKEVEINEEWNEYWTTFISAVSSPIWLRIALGTSKVSIWVDNVRFYEGQYAEEADLRREKAIHPVGKLSGCWGSVKSRREFSESKKT